MEGGQVAGRVRGTALLWVLSPVPRGKRSPEGNDPQPRTERPAPPSALLLPGPAAPFPGPQLGSRTSCGEPRTWGMAGEEAAVIGERVSRVGCESRQVAHSLCLRSPASAWSPSSSNAPFRGSSRPLSPHRMADGGSPFLGRRDFVYPSSTRGKDQILPFFLPDACRYAPDTLVPPGVGWGGCRKIIEPPASTGARRGS